MKKHLSLFAVVVLAIGGSACAHHPYLSSSKTAEDAYEECHRLSESKDYEKANECFEVLKSRFGGSRAAYEADIEVGDNYFRKGDYLLAAETYIAFTKLHPSDEKAGYAYYRTGLCYLRENPKAIDRDQKYLETAIQYFELALPQVSGDLSSFTSGSERRVAGSDLKDLVREKWTEARSRIARRHYHIGRFYHKTGEYRAAIPRFQEVVTNYSGLGLDEKSLFLMGDSYVRLSEKERALEILGVFEQHFPDSRYRKKLASQIGVK